MTFVRSKQRLFLGIHHLKVLQYAIFIEGSECACHGGIAVRISHASHAHRVVSNSFIPPRKTSPNSIFFSGIGALVAERFASEGANVAINYVSNEERAKETESKITSQYNVKTTIIQGVCCAAIYVSLIRYDARKTQDSRLTANSGSRHQSRLRQDSQNSHRKIGWAGYCGFECSPSSLIFLFQAIYNSGAIP